MAIPDSRNSDDRRLRFVPVHANHNLVHCFMELLSHSIAIIADLISSGLQPIPALKQYGLPYSIFDLVGSLRLALVIRQIREAERAKALSQQRKLTAEGSSNIRELEESYYIKDFATVCTVIYGGEVVCCMLIFPFLR